MLEPDKRYTLEYRETTTAPWSVLAAIDVTSANEGWSLDTRAVAAIGTAAQIRLSCVSSLPDVPNLLLENTPTVIAWNEHKTGVEYLPTGSTFSGSYTYATPGIGTETAKGILAMNIQIQARAEGGATISSILWYTPGASGTASPVTLASSGESVILSRVDTKVTPAYSDPCYSADSKLI